MNTQKILLEPMSRKVFELHRQGLSYREISNKLGISFRHVGDIMMADRRCEKWIDPETAKYPALAVWMNENHVTRSELCRLFYLTPCSNAVTRVTQYINGKRDLHKFHIDILLEVTGMTYEELFRTELEDDGSCVEPNLNGGVQDA